MRNKNISLRTSSIVVERRISQIESKYPKFRFFKIYEVRKVPRKPLLYLVLAKRANRMKGWFLVLVEIKGNEHWYGRLLTNAES